MAVKEAVIQVRLDPSQAEKGIKKLTKSFKVLDNYGSKHLVRTFAKLASVVGFTKMTLDATAFSRSMGLLADRAGIASSHLSDMRTAFNAFNRSGDDAVKLVDKFSRGIGGFRFGDKTLSNLAALGVQTQGKTAEELMYGLADWAKLQKDAGMSVQEIYYLLEKNFGIGGQLAQLMLKGGNFMRSEYAKSIQAIGGKTKEQDKNTRELDSALGRLSATFDSLKQKIVGDLAPAITTGVNALIKVGEWFNKHDEIAATCTALVTLLSALSGFKMSVGVLGLIKALTIGKTAAAATTAATAGTAIGGGGLLGLLTNPWTAVATGVLSVGANAYAWGKLALQDTVKDPEYWDKFEKEQYDKNIKSGMNHNTAMAQAKIAANYGRRWNGLLKDEEMPDVKIVYEGEEEEFPDFKDSSIVWESDENPVLPDDFSKAITDGNVVNQINVQNDITVNPDGTATTQTNINGTTFTNNGSQPINYTEMSQVGA